MNNQVKKYLGLFFLALFIFPQIEKELHAIEHASDFHCNSIDKHFHPLEHSCDLCDYTVTDNLSSKYYKVKFIIFEKTVYYSPFLENVNIPSAFSDIPPRAPPIA